MNHPSARGFTLVEVLLATALLASGVALAFATLSAAGEATERSTLVARHNERMRAVERVLRARITAARALAVAADGEEARMFAGSSGEMVFVADLPAYLGHGGPYRHRFTVLGAPGSRRLEFDFAPVQDGQVLEPTPPRPPELLADGLEDVRFRYRGLDDKGRLGPWQESWQGRDSLPLAVEVRIDEGDRGAWPPLVVAVPMASSGAGGRRR